MKNGGNKVYDKLEIIAELRIRVLKLRHRADALIGNRNVHFYNLF